MDDLTEAVSGGGAAARGPGSPGAPKPLAPKGRGGTTAAQGQFNALHPRAAKGRTGGGQFATKSKPAGGGQQKRAPQSIAEFQKSRGLPVTGRMDSATAIAWRNAQTAAKEDAKAAAAGKGAGASVTAKAAKGPVLGRNEYAKPGMGTAKKPDARVRRVQDAMEKLGYDVARDGQYGPELEGAVRQFQKDHGLQTTGIVDVATMRRMATLRAQVDAGASRDGSLSADEPARRSSGGPVKPRGATGKVSVKKVKNPTAVVMQASVEEPWRMALGLVRSGEVWVRVADPPAIDPAETFDRSAPLGDHVVEECNPEQSDPSPTHGERAGEWSTLIAEQTEPDDPPDLERLPDEEPDDRVVVDGKEFRGGDVTDADWFKEMLESAVQEARDWRSVLHPRNRRGEFRDTFGIPHPHVARSVSAPPAPAPKVPVPAEVSNRPSVGAKRRRESIPTPTPAGDRILTMDFGEGDRQSMLAGGKRLVQEEPVLGEAIRAVGRAHRWPELLDNLEFKVQSLGAASGEFTVAPKIRPEDIDAARLEDPDAELPDVRDEAWWLAIDPLSLQHGNAPSTFAHEAGHMLDAALSWGDLGDRRREVPGGNGFFASGVASSPAADEFMSPGRVQAWRQFLMTAVTPSVLLSRMPEDYFRSPQELWARAYGQWITTTDTSVGELLVKAATEQPQVNNTWPLDEWEPVGRAVEGVLAAYGLLHEEDRHRWVAEPGIEMPSMPPSVLAKVVEVGRFTRSLEDPSPALRHFGFKPVAPGPGEPYAAANRTQRWELEAGEPGSSGLLVATHPPGGPIKLHWEPGASLTPGPPSPPQYPAALPGAPAPRPPEADAVMKEMGALAALAHGMGGMFNGGRLTPEELLRTQGFRPLHPLERSEPDWPEWELEFPTGWLRVRHKPVELDSMQDMWLGRDVGADPEYDALTDEEQSDRDFDQALEAYDHLRQMIRDNPRGTHFYVTHAGETHMFEIWRADHDSLMLTPLMPDGTPGPHEVTLEPSSHPAMVGRLLLIASSQVELKTRREHAAHMDSIRRREITMQSRNEVPKQPPWPPGIDFDTDPDGAVAAMAAHRDAKAAWAREVSEGLSLGRFTWEQARAEGFGSPAYPWEPLPDVPLYHATTALSRVKVEGLKTRDELGQGSGAGLGGGDNTTISVTTNREVAEAVAVGLREMRAVARGETSIADMLAQAARGDRGSKPFVERLVSYYDRGGSWKPGDPWPPEIRRLLEGKRRAHRGPMIGTREEIAAAEGVSPEAVTHTGADYSMLGNGARGDWEIPDDPIETAVSFYKSYASFREEAGGIENPMFFSSDTRALAQTPLSEIGIVTLRPAPGAQGSKVNGMDEWRTGTGKALVPDVPVQEARVRAVERLRGPMGRTVAQRPDVGAFAAKLGDLVDGEATAWHSSAFSGRVRREGETFHIRAQGHHEDVFSGTRDEVARWTADMSAEGAVRQNDPVATTTDVAEAWDEARHPRDPKGRFAEVARGIERMGGSPELAQAFASGTANTHDVYAAQRLANAHRGSRDYVPKSGARLVDEILGTSSRPPVMVGGAITMHALPGSPITLEYRGMPGTSEIDGVTVYESRAHAELVASSIPRSRVVKRKKGYVVMTGNTPHRSPFTRPFKGDAWADTLSVAEAHRVERKLADIHVENLLIAEAADSLRKASTPEPFSHSKTSNWVARNGGLPAYIQHIAHDLVEKRGKSESQAIQMAIGIVKRWARGGGNVDAGTKAAAAKAVAEWTALKAKAHSH